MINYQDLDYPQIQRVYKKNTFQVLIKVIWFLVLTAHIFLPKPKTNVKEGIPPEFCSHNIRLL